MRQLERYGWSALWQEKLDALGQPELLPGRVSQVTRSFCQVLTGQGECSLRIPGRLRHKHRNPLELPAVGDWVAYAPGSAEVEGVVESVLPRQGLISRQMPGRRGSAVEQPIAANVDIAFLVCGLDRDFNLRRIERYLALLHASGARPVVILNKADLCPDAEARQQEVRELFAELDVHLTVARQTLPCEVTTYLAPGVTIAFLGSSGVGKSTLINALLGYQRQQTGEISEALGKGKHTTTYRELISLENGALLIDNPGMRELQLSGSTADLAGTFDEIDALVAECRFNNCRHLSEPGCAVRGAVDQGLVSEERYRSFLKLQTELEQYQLRQGIGSEAAEKERWRGISKALKKRRRSGWQEDE